MSAIAGVWRKDGRPGACEDVALMLSAQRMYGPDASNAWADRNIALGRQLMRSLPEDAFDVQPLGDSSGRNRLVADVRLDNRDELADLLGIAAASTKSDAAILLAAYERWGEASCDRLVGDYAFAVWSIAEQRLFLARDPLGCRPLHYFIGANSFAFASMPKGLHALPEVPYGVDEEFFSEMLLAYLDDGTRTFFRDIRKVAPGHVVIVERDKFTAKQHWRPPVKLLRLGRPEDYQDVMRAKLDDAVRCRLRGADDIATQLSGGLDSSAVTATAARLMTPRRVVAFTSVPRQGFAESDPRGRITDEGAHAATLAARYPNIEHVRIPTPALSPMDGLDRNFDLYEIPIANLCNLGWIDAINDAARERSLRVMLIGSMGNFTASYAGIEALAHLLRRGRWLRLGREAAKLMQTRQLSWRGALFHALGTNIPMHLWRLLGKRASGGASLPFSNPARHAEVRARVPFSRSAHALIRPSVDSVALRMKLMRVSDLAPYYKGVLANWRLDWRDPFSDRRLVEFCLSVPIEQFLRNGVARALARSSFADRVPRTIIDETRRGLQSADWHIALTQRPERLIDEIDEIAASALARRLLDINALKQAANELPTEGWGTAATIARFRAGMLRTISLGHFLRQVDRVVPR